MTIQEVLNGIGNLSEFAARSEIPFSTLRRMRKSGKRPLVDTLRKLERGLEMERERTTEAIGAVRAMIAMREKR